MSTPAEMAERHGAVLAELAELGLTLARGLHAKALAAETPDEAVELGAAFHQISRSVRQTLALEARLERERLRPLRPTVAAPTIAPRDHLPIREARPRPAVERLGWDEAERPDTEDTEDLFGDLADELSAALRDDALPSPAGTRVGRRRADLDVLAAPRELALAGAAGSAGEGWPPPPVPPPIRPPMPARPPAYRAAAPPPRPGRPGPS